MSQLRVPISGAGIAGLSAAFWLSRYGHDVTVIERFPNLRSTGLQIDLRGHGIEVLKQMDLEKDFRAKSVPEKGMEVVDGSSRRWAFFPANRSNKGVQSFTSDLEIMRGDFVRLLYDAVKVKHDGTVEVLLSGGSKAAFDLLIGADGQGSYTRKWMLGAGVPDPITFLNGWASYFTFPRPATKQDQYIVTLYIATRSRSITLRRHLPDRVQCYLGCGSRGRDLEKVKKGDVVKEKEALKDIFKDAGWKAPEVLKALEYTEDFYCERPGVVRLVTWSKDRVVLVGDAAYCPTVNTGMGTTSAVVGSYILAGEISATWKAEASGQSLTTALKSYEDKFRPFMDQVQKGIGEGKGGFGLIPTSPVGIFMLNCFLWICSIFKVDILSKFVLREKIENWELPSYTVLDSDWL